MNATNTTDLNGNTDIQIYNPSFDIGCQEAAKRIIAYILGVDTAGIENVDNELMSKLVSIMKEEIIGNVNFNQS